MKDEIKKALEQATPGPWKEEMFKEVSHPEENYRVIKGGKGFLGPDKVGFRIVGLIKPEDSLILGNSFVWLRWQNERIEQLEKERDKESKRADFWQMEQLDARKANLNLIERVGQLEKALEQIYEYDGGNFSYDYCAMKDIARQALGKEE